MIADSASIVGALAVVAGKVLVLVVLGTLAARGLRRSSAAARHALWTVVLVGVCVLALSPFRSSRWDLPLPPALAASAESLVAPARSLGPASPSPVPPSAPQRTGRFGAFDALLLVWLGGVATLGARFVVGRAALGRVVSRSSALERMSLHDGLGRRVRLIETDELSVPATWGTLRPVIALPTDARTWSTNARLAALRHELAHVRRHDALTRALGDLVCAALWFHPGTWLVSHRMRAESERACDDAVLAAGGSDVGYAELLLTLAGGMSRRAGVHAMAEARELERRLRAILDPSTPRSSSRSVVVAASASVLLVAFALGGARLQASPAASGAQADLSDERVEMTPAEEHHALERSFRPRDPREAEAFARLTEATRHEKQHALDFVRERATWALSIADTDRVIAPLISALEDDDWRVRAYAATLLGIVDARESAEPLADRLDDPAWRVRAAAADTLARMPVAPGADRMLELLDDPAWQVRLAAVEFCGRVRTPETREALRLRLSDAHVGVRSAAQTALSE
jgi:beta-lactamase regulating signal transducer with metallopeptidase domain